MNYALSLLDKSPAPDGATAQQAIQHSVKLAQRAEALGYKRFWVAEHHGSTLNAGSAPEVLVAHILAKTSHIRVGSGGVMLQHYSPYKVAEVFKVLSALAPGRVDLGVGKAPGGLPLSTRALQVGRTPARKLSFDRLLADLDAFLHNQLPEDHALAGAVATPQPASLPECTLLGAAPESALLAARHGWGFCYAGHFNGDPANLVRALDAYRQASGCEPSVALYAFAAADRDQARERVGALRIFKLHLATGQSVNLPSAEAAEEFARQASVVDYRIEETQPHVIAGTAEDVLAALDELHERHGIQEFVIDTPVAQFADRLASVELLAPHQQAVAA